MSALPELDRGAESIADLAWLETDGSLAEKTTAAIRAYLWATAYADEHDGWFPSLNDWRAAADQDGGSHERLV